jgi:F-type H+-transporting ATPase subunit a
MGTFAASVATVGNFALAQFARGLVLADEVGLEPGVVERSGPEFPTIDDFFPPEVLLVGTPLAMDRIWFVRVIATVLLLLVFCLAARRVALVPGRFQCAVEYLIDFVRKQIVEEVLGQEVGRRYMPMLCTIFFSVLFFNLTGIIPFLNISGTARVGIPLLLALWVLVTYWAAGARAHGGILRFLKDELFPESLRKMPYMYIIVTPIELLQLLIIRPASLTIRLVANMIVGHITLLLCFAATQYFAFHARGLMHGFAALTLFGGIFMTLFEMLVAFLQAYIFTLLATVYIDLAMQHEAEPA